MPNKFAKSLSGDFCLGSMFLEKWVLYRIKYSIKSKQNLTHKDIDRIEKLLSKYLYKAYLVAEERRIKYKAIYRDLSKDVEQCKSMLIDLRLLNSYIDKGEKATHLLSRKFAYECLILNNTFGKNIKIETIRRYYHLVIAFVLKTLGEIKKFLEDVKTGGIL